MAWRNLDNISFQTPDTYSPSNFQDLSEGFPGMNAGFLLQAFYRWNAFSNHKNKVLLTARWPHPHGLENLFSDL